MNINDYQNEAGVTAIYDGQGSNLIYPTLGLVGEAAEIANKVKKPIRKFGVNTDFEDEFKKELAKELGDVLWYVAVISTEIGYSLEEIAQMNLDKLKDRAERGVLEGSGDNR
jgi:NTP pyrophosphatase (non-canonical NTP hydrolase)